MARIKNPATVYNKEYNAKLTVAITLTTPPAVKEYLDAVLSSIPEIQEGRYYAINKQDWENGSAYRLEMFTVEDGNVKTDNGVTVSTDGTLLLRLWSTATNMRVTAGDVFEFIEVDRSL